MEKNSNNDINNYDWPEFIKCISKYTDIKQVFLKRKNNISYSSDSNVFVI
jgi:hypothetical protein